MQTGAHYTSEAVKPNTNASSVLYASAMVMIDPMTTHATPTNVAGHAASERLVLLVSKVDHPISVQVDGGAHAPVEILEASGDEPGFVPPRSFLADGAGLLTLGPYAVALVALN